MAAELVDHSSEAAHASDWSVTQFIRRSEKQTTDRLWQMVAKFCPHFHLDLKAGFRLWVLLIENSDRETYSEEICCLITRLYWYLAE